ncbi:LysM domain-containing protein [Streptococcus thermophilus]|uniref:LysM peptidoglycan-binding domain-containing protein n=1 Tax=Streptococcus thermophilus TaxID=1308 RepID=UPI001A98D15C|nr:LysM domain-containing protein [Streptococcus thermophilus]MBO1147174.1 LysM peptidoglycan-binding domain-containing protein [Streptococcus thermophilus]MBO1149953.1 LysM peptidoglycan-binding domain-containing protein [Streptococcus thermophilus]MBO1151571.1 LysM peptidoglycan-binding domain-containing protein [Streptococcus thermophilus]MBO1153184.1 LysM peptidoglycan-binding domain-containing protein [Streptococcus thermophilus]MBO1155333.1 LysM peptidoglycan-binding domain-containing pr
MKKKNYVSKAVMLGALLAPIGLPTVSVLADGFYQNQTSAHAADITNWIASTPQQITNNLTTQNINPQQLDGQQYVIQWGDTLWGISQATGISIEKLAYDNNIQNIDLIFAGDVLILKRDGDVPAGYHVTGNGHRCAHSKIVINNYYGDNNRVIINNSTFVSDDHSKNTMIYAPDNSDNSISFSNTNNSDKDKDSKESKESSSSSSSSSESKDASSSSSSSSESKDASSSSTSSSASSSTASGSESKASTDTSKEKELTEDAFQDKIQEEVSNIYQQKCSGRPAWKFFSHVDDKNDLNADAKEDTERTALYRQGETAKDEDIANGPKDVARTEANAKALAEKIYDTLNNGGKMSELIKAKYAQIKVTYKGDKWTFNVDVYKEKESSSSSTETSSESKASSSDDSQTETRMSSSSSSSSSSHTETDLEANSSDLTGDE